MCACRRLQGHLRLREALSAFSLAAGGPDAGQWESQAELGEAFLAWSSWSYDGHVNAHANRSGLEKAFRHVQVVLHNQDNREHDVLDSDDYYQFHGGMTAAVRHYGFHPLPAWRCVFANRMKHA